MRVRKSDERGRADHGWLDSRHTFSFAEYHDAQHMGFRALRVINEDLVAPGRGFDTHGHRDMEIITYMLAGALQHEDSMGNGSVIRPGDVQRMSAGTGVLHSEWNASASERAHLLQIWILPAVKGARPSYEQRTFPRERALDRLELLASRDGRDGSVTVHQDVSLWRTILSPRQSITHPIEPGRHVWLQVASGQVRANGTPLAAGDGAALSEEREVTLVGEQAAELLLFDLG